MNFGKDTDDNNLYDIICPYLDCGEKFPASEREFRVFPDSTYVNEYFKRVKAKKNEKEKNRLEHFEEDIVSDILLEDIDKGSTNSFEDFKFYFNLESSDKALQAKIDKLNNAGNQKMKRHSIYEPRLKSYKACDLEKEEGIRLIKNKNVEDFVQSFEDRNMQTSQVVVCPYCKRKLPSKIGLVKMKTMPIVGITNSGKTAYIIALHESLSADEAKVPEDYLDEIKKGTTVDFDISSEKNYPFFTYVGKREGNEEGIFATYNLAGEGLTNDEYREYRDKIVRPIIEKSDAIMIIIPPHQIETLRMSPPPRNLSDDNEDSKNRQPSLSLLMKEIYDLYDTRSVDKDIKIIVGLSMLDRIAEEWENKLKINENGRLMPLKRAELLRAILANRRLGNKEIFSTSYKIQEFLKTSSEDNSVEISKLISRFNPRFFGMQVGPRVDKFKYIPYGVVEPIYWLLER